jgi:hypothetical protein
MSMLYYLAKITPEFVVEVRARPELIRDLFFADDSSQRSDFKKKTDILDGNWLHLGRLASTFAQPGPKPVDFVAQDTWLSKAVNGSTADALALDFGYGPVWALAPHRVAEVAKGLKAEAAALPADPSELGDSDDSVLFYSAEVAAIARFYGAAARQGRAVVGVVL